MKRRLSVFLCVASILAISFFACKGAGKDVDKKKGGNNPPATTTPELKLSKIKVKGKPITNPSAKEWEVVVVGKNDTTIVSDDIDAIFEYGGKTDDKIKVKVEGGGTLNDTTPQTFHLSVAKVEGKHGEWKHDVKVRKAKADEDAEPVLDSMKIHERRVDKDAWTVAVPNDKTTVVPDDVKAFFTYKGRPAERISVQVTIEGELKEGVAKPVKITLPAVAGSYSKWERTINVTREVKNIEIKKYYIDDEELANIADVKSVLNKDSCIVKIEVEGEYADVKIAGEKVNYTAPVAPAIFGSYSKTISGLEKDTEREISIVITDAKFANSPFSKTLKVMRKDSKKMIDIKGYYVDGALFLDPNAVKTLSQDSCTIKIVVGGEYQDVKIDGGAKLNYESPVPPSIFGSYSKTISGLEKGKEKEIKIEIADSSCTPSEFKKTIKVKYEDASAYTAGEWQRITVGENGEKSWGANENAPTDIKLPKTSKLLISVLYKKTVPAGKEKMKVTLDGTTIKEGNASGRKVEVDCGNLAVGSHTVKLEQLYGEGFANVGKTVNFNVEVKEVKKKITVSGVDLETDGESVHFRETTTGGNRSLRELLNGDADLYEENIKKDKLKIKVNVETEGCNIQCKIGDANFEAMANNTVKEFEVKDKNKDEIVQIKIEKDGHESILYRFKAVHKSVKVTEVSIDGKSYTWEQFKALETGSPIDVSKEKIDITVTWSNTQTIEATLKSGSKNIAGNVANNKATWKDFVVSPGENEWRLTVKVSGGEVGFDWKSGKFKLKRAESADSNTNIADLKVIGFLRPSITSPKAIEWPFAKIGMNEFELYVKPESAEIKGMKVKQPSESAMTKLDSGSYSGYYKANMTISSGSKLVFEVEAKDGTKQEWFVTKEGKLGKKGQYATGIAMSKFFMSDKVRYGESAGGGYENQKPFENFVAKVPVGKDKDEIFLQLSYLHFEGMQDIEASADYTISSIEKNKKANFTGVIYDVYILKVDTSSIANGSNKEIEIHLKFKDSKDQIVDLFNHAGYKIKLEKAS